MENIENQNENIQEQDYIDTNEEQSFFKKYRRVLPIGLLAFIVLSSIIYCFFYWMKTPAYSLRLVQEAIEKHDFSTFEKHVDLNSVFSKAFNDVIADSIGTTNTNKNDSRQTLALSIMQGIKTAAIPGLIADTKHFVETGTYLTSANTNEEALTSGILENSGATNDMILKSIDKTTKDGSGAIVDITLHDARVNTDFILKLKMVENADKTWRVIEIVNLKEYLDAHKVAASKRLAELNKEEQEKINDLVDIDNNNIKGTVIKSEDTFTTPQLNVALKAIVHTEKAINNCFINFAVVDLASEKQLFMGVIKAEIPAGKKDRIVPLSYSWPLNPFISEQKKFVDSSLQGTALKAHVVAIKTQDGAELTLLEKIPSSKVSNSKEAKAGQYS